MKRSVMANWCGVGCSLYYNWWAGIGRDGEGRLTTCSGGGGGEGGAGGAVGGFSGGGEGPGTESIVDPIFLFQAGAKFSALDAVVSDSRSTLPSTLFILS